MFRKTQRGSRGGKIKYFIKTVALTIIILYKKMNSYMYFLRFAFANAQSACNEAL